MARLESFREWPEKIRAGVAISAVEPLDLKRVYELFRDVQMRDKGSGGQTAVGLGLIKNICSPGVDVLAACTRVMALNIMRLENPDMLGPWQHGEELDDKVFKVAATIPLNGVKLNQNAFKEQLGALNQ